MHVPAHEPWHVASHVPSHCAATSAVPSQTALALQVPWHCTLSWAGSHRVTTSICPGLQEASTWHSLSHDAWTWVSTVHTGALTRSAKFAVAFTSRMMTSISADALSQAPVP